MEISGNDTDYRPFLIDVHIISDDGKLLMMYAFFKITLIERLCSCLRAFRLQKQSAHLLQEQNTLKARRLDSGQVRLGLYGY